MVQQSWGTEHWVCRSGPQREHGGQAREGACGNKCCACRVWACRGDQGRLDSADSGNIPGMDTSLTDHLLRVNFLATRRKPWPRLKQQMVTGPRWCGERPSGGPPAPAEVGVGGPRRVLGVGPCLYWAESLDQHDPGRGNSLSGHRGLNGPVLGQNEMGSKLLHQGKSCFS